MAGEFGAYIDNKRKGRGIGGEDIKVIKCNAENNIENFYLNDKCAAGTGSYTIVDK